jgi:hypothetical protein
MLRKRIPIFLQRDGARLDAAPTSEGKAPCDSFRLSFCLN